MIDHKVTQAALNVMSENCMQQLNKEIFIDKKIGLIEIREKRRFAVNGERFVLECSLSFDNKGNG